MHRTSLLQISGDGNLDKSASIPGSDKPTRFDSLEIYLVSYQTKQNITVSAGPDLLTREPDSTVKHWDFNVSTCIPAGSYNVSSMYHCAVPSVARDPKKTNSLRSDCVLST